MRARRGLSHVHVGSLHAPDAEMALRNARDVYTRRGEGVSLWVVRASDITASTPDEKRLVLRPGGRQDLPAPDVLRRPRRGRAPLVDQPLCDYTLGSGRRRARLGPAAGLVDQPRARARGGRRPRQHRARPARPGADAAHLRRRARGSRPLRGRPRLPPRRPRLPQRAAGRAPDDRLRRRDGAAAGARDLPVRALRRRCSVIADATLAGDRGKAVKEVAYHRRPRHPLGAAPRRRHRRVPRRGCRRRSTPSGRTSTSCSTPLAPIARRPRRRPGDLRDAVLSRPSRVVLTQATLTVPEVAPALGGGRQGLHTEHLGYLLAEMQHLPRSHPGATW